MLSDYEILGVGTNANPQEIKKAYFTLAKRYHPDLSLLPRAEAEVKMVELNKAYSRLSQGQTQDEEVGVIYADPTNPYANLAYHYANENVQRLCMEAMQKLIGLNNNEALEKLCQQFYEDTSYTVGRLIAVGVMEPLTAELYGKTLEHFNK